jgi:hypothetical protein
MLMILCKKLRLFVLVHDRIHNAPVCLVNRSPREGHEPLIQPTFAYNLTSSISMR